MFVKLSKLSLVGRTLRWLRASCQTDHQGSISASCTRRGSLEVCSSLSRSSPSAFSWFDSIHLLSCLSGRLCKGLVSFGFRGASLERQIPKLSRKGYSCQCITHFGCCIKRKPRENIQVCVNVLPTSYRQVTDRLPTGYRQVTDTLPTVGRLSADR